MNVSDLLRFTITKIRTLDLSDDGSASFVISGCVSGVGQLEVGSRYWLYVDGGAGSPIADITSVDQTQSTALMDGITFSSKTQIRIGDSYPIITAYWNSYLYAAILDEQRAWTKTSFKATGAFETTHSGYTVRTSPARAGISREYPSDAAVSEDSVRVVDAGWDHEHCAVCNRRIDAGNPIGYVDNDGSWLCDKCYETFAAHHDLKFIAEYPEWGR